MSGEDWHPASDPPDTERVVMLRFGGELQKRGYYGNWYGAWRYTYLNGRASIGAARPTHWRELTEEEAMKPHETIRKRLVNAENELTIAQQQSRDMAPKIVEALIASGLTLRQVARRIGRSPTYVSHIRTGIGYCSPKTYFELSLLLSGIEKEKT